MSRPELRISARRFRANLAAVSERIAPSTLMLVIKDDAYGHGLNWAVQSAVAAGVEWFGSYDIGTAVAARRAAPDAQRIFAWATSDDAEVDEALEHDIDLGVGSAGYLRRIVERARARGERARIHLKIDTGLHRNGIPIGDWATAVAEVRAAEQDGVLELAGVWSHLSEASDADDDEAHDVFRDAVARVREVGSSPEELHLTASAASWWRPELRGSLSRIGAFCYGIRSAEGPELENVLPVAELAATVTSVSGEDVLIDIGSFDGLPSTLAGLSVGTPGGQRPLRRIEATTATVGAWPGARAGDDVWLFGAGGHGEHSATALAESIGTVGEEILTRLTARVRRVVVDES